MNKSMKSAVISAVVFPGAGHLFLRCYTRGIILIAISALALIEFIRRAWHEAELISAQISKEIDATGVVDLQSLITHATAAVDRVDNGPFTIATVVFLACWLIAIVDSYRIGKQLEEFPPPP